MDDFAEKFNYPIVFLLVDSTIEGIVDEGYNILSRQILEDCEIDPTKEITIDQEIMLKSYLNDSKYTEIATLIDMNW